MSGLIQFASATRIEAAAETKKPTRVTVMAYDGGIMRVPGWGPVIVDLAGLKMGGSVPLLADHENTLSAVAGSGKPAVRDNRLYVEGVLADDAPAAEQTKVLIAAGVELQASVGVEPDVRKWLQAGEKIRANGRTLTVPAAGALLVISGTLKEVSIVAIGADGATSVSLAARYAGLKGANQMPNELTEPNPGTTATDPPDATQAAVLAERQRIGKIDQICARYGMGSDWSYREQAINGQVSLDVLEATASRLVDLRKSRPDAPSVITSGHHAVDKDVLAAAVMIRAGFESLAAKHYGDQATSRARGMRHFMDVIEAAYQVDGRNVPQGRNEMIRGAFGASTMSLPMALTEAGNRIVMQAYAEAPKIWPKIAKAVDVKDFRPTKALRPNLLGGAPQEVGADGELKHAYADESLYGTLQLGTYGQVFRVTRKDIVNDDLGAVQELATAMAPNASRGVSDLFAKVLMGNADDHFGEANGNYIHGSDSVLTFESLANAVLKLRRQADKDGRPLDLVPATLAVPPELETLGRAILQSVQLERYTSSTRDNQPTANPLQGLAELAVDARFSSSAFTGHSLTKWWLFAAAQNAPIHAAFLNGQRSPTVEWFGLDSDPNTLAVTWRCFFDYAFALGDPKAGVCSAGA